MKMELGIGQGIRQGTTQLGWGGGVAAIANHRNYFRCHGDDGDDNGNANMEKWEHITPNRHLGIASWNKGNDSYDEDEED